MVQLKSKDIINSMHSSLRLSDIVELRRLLTADGCVDINKFSDDDLARFIIARNGNLEKAKTLLAAHIAWRSATLPINMTSCLTEFNKGKVYLHGVDKQGHPVVVYRSKLQIPSDRNLDEMLKMCVWWAERVISLLPDDKSKVTILVDRSDSGMQNSDMEFVRAMAGVFQNNYPERLCRAIVYPSGLIFYTIWNLIKWFLDPVTQDKVKPVLTLAGVQEFIADEFIPLHMGGQSDYSFCPANYCSELTSDADKDGGQDGNRVDPESSSS